MANSKKKVEIYLKLDLSNLNSSPITYINVYARNK